MNIYNQTQLRDQYSGAVYIHLEEPGEAVYWAKKFEVPAIQLLKAVRATGSNKVEKIAEYLAKAFENQ